MYTHEYYTALAYETGACCALFAAGGDCEHSLSPEDEYPSAEETHTDEWYLENGTWTNDSRAKELADETAARNAWLQGQDSDYVPF